MSEEIEIKIKCSNETKLSIKVTLSDTILDLKKKITEELKSTSIPTEPSEQRLIYAGRILKDTETILDIKIKEGNTIHFVRSKPKVAPTEKSAEVKTPTSATTTSATTTTSTTSTTTGETPVSANQPRAPQSSPMTGTDNPFSSLLGAGGAAAANPFLQLGMNSGFNAGMRGQMPPMPQMPPLDPEVLNSMINNPAIMNMMSSMMSNPQFSDMMFGSNPQLAQFNTPEFRSIVNQMMSNPETLRAMLQMYSGTLGANPNAGAVPPMPQYNPFFNFMAPPPPPAQTNTTTTTNTTPAQPATVPPPMQPDFSSLFNLFGNMNNPAANAQSNVPQQPPEERYSSQLAQLQDMGFYDSQQNIRALTISGGRVEAAVEWLLNNPSY